MLVNSDAWRADFKSKEDAIKAIESPLVKELRGKIQQGRNRKAKCISTIQKAWGNDVKHWRFECLGENNLWHISAGRKSS